MDSILHDRTNLPSVIIAIICEYCVFELDEKVKKLYLNYVNAKMKLPISKINPSTQLRYLSSSIYPMRIYEQLYINHITSKHIDFLLKNSHLVINAEHVFEIIFKEKLVELFGIKLCGKTIIQSIPHVAEQYVNLMNEYDQLITIDDNSIIDNNTLTLMLYNYDPVYEIPVRNKILTMNEISKDLYIKLIYSGNYKVLNRPIQSKYLSFDELIKHKWYRDELYMHHKKKITTPITFKFNLHKNTCLNMDDYLSKIELDFYYTNVYQNWYAHVPYYFNKYYTKRDEKLIQIYGNVKYYLYLCNINITEELFQNKNINELISHF